jgi:hypothetical protein
MHCEIKVGGGSTCQEKNVGGMKFFFAEKNKKNLASVAVLPYSLGMANIIPFPADSTEYEEYVSVMNELAEIAEASTPDPQPSDFN